MKPGEIWKYKVDAKNIFPQPGWSKVFPGKITGVIHYLDEFLVLELVSVTEPDGTINDWIHALILDKLIAGWMKYRPREYDLILPIDETLQKTPAE